MADSPIRNVSDTAFMVASYRAIESERYDALFNDHLARRLAGPEGLRILDALGRATRMGVWALAIRTVVIDDYIKAAIAGGVTTVLNLGAGLDARPYRLALPKTLRWIEVDYPHMIELKEGRLTGEKARCQLERVKLDLADRAARQKLFAEVNRDSAKVLVLTEGVIPYLTAEEVAPLADDLRAQDHFTRWIVDYFSPDMMKYRRRQSISRYMANAPFRFEPKDWFGFFSEHGWRKEEIRYLHEESARLNRPIPIPAPLLAFIRLARKFAPAGRDGMRTFAGLVLLVPSG